MIPGSTFNPNDGSLTSTAVGQVVLEPGLPEFQETITGSSSDVFYQGIVYHHSYDFYSGGAVDPWVYEYPLDASLTLTMSVAADNPIDIDFTGNSGSAVTITSDAPVILNGQITAPNGVTTIDSRGSITQDAGASIATTTLNLNAAGATSSIGAAQQPIAATLSALHVLSAQAGDQGVYLDLGSARLSIRSPPATARAITATSRSPRRATSSRRSSLRRGLPPSPAATSRSRIAPAASAPRPARSC